MACQGRFLSGTIEGATRSLVANLSLPACRSREFDAAKQFVGWAVASIMRSHGHGIVDRSRVPGKLFTVAAIWRGNLDRRPENSVGVLILPAGR